MSFLYSLPNVRHSLVAGAIVILSLLLPHFSHAQTASQVAGSWTGTIEIPGTSLEIVLSFPLQEDDQGTYSIPAQGVSDFPLNDLSVEDGTVSFSLGGGIPGNPSFSLLIVNDNELSGSFTQSGSTFDARFRRKQEIAAEPDAGEKLDRDVQREIQSYIDSIRTLWDVPGLSVAVIHDGEEMTFVSGLRDVAAKKEVTEETRFAIGSTTKAFTATLLGILADEGLIDWDEPVITYLDDFQLLDKEATERLRVRDLLTHVSGLPRHDLLWYLGSRLGREELYHRLRYLEPVGPSGQEWRYQNLMYMTAGLLAERVTGKNWEELIEAKILEPLNMSAQTSLDVETLATDPDRSLAYQKNEEEIKEIPYRSLGAIAPAGSINASAKGILPWLRLNLGISSTSSMEVIDPTTLRVIHAPQVVMPEAIAFRGKDLSLYGMGWMISYYRGERIVYHGGSIDGFQAHIALLPEESCAISVFTNRQSALPEAMTLDLIDILRHESRYRHAARLFEQVETMVASSGDRPEEKRIEGTQPSRPLAEYAGRYAHPAYDTILVEEVEGKLKVSYFDLSSRLVHRHYDVFEVDPADDLLGIQVIFNGALDGSIRSLSSLLEPMLDPIEFTRLADARLSDPEYLRRYAGSYQLSGQRMVIREVDGTLKLSIPSQPEYRLVASRLDEEGRALFAIEGLQGFTVRFAVEEGKTIATFLQPNGTFVATKK